MIVEAWRFARDGRPPDAPWFVFDADSPDADLDAPHWKDRVFGGSTRLLAGPIGGGLWCSRMHVDVRDGPGRSLLEVTSIRDWATRDATLAFRAAALERVEALAPEYEASTEHVEMIDRVLRAHVPPSAGDRDRARAWAAGAVASYLRALGMGAAGRALHAEMIAAQIVDQVARGGPASLSLMKQADFGGEAAVIRARFVQRVLALFA